MLLIPPESGNIGSAAISGSAVTSTAAGRSQAPRPASPQRRRTICLHHLLFIRWQSISIGEVRRVVLGAASAVLVAAHACQEKDTRKDRGCSFLCNLILPAWRSKSHPVSQLCWLRWAKMVYQRRHPQGSRGHLAPRPRAHKQQNYNNCSTSLRCTRRTKMRKWPT